MVSRAPRGSGMGTPDRVGRLPPHTRPAAGSTCGMVGRKLRQRHESAVRLLAEGVAQVRVDQLIDALEHVPDQRAIGSRLIDIEGPTQVGASMPGRQVEPQGRIKVCGVSGPIRLGREHTTARQVRDCGRVERGHVARSSQVPVYSGGRNSGPAWDVCDASKNSPDMRDCGYSATLACARLRQPRLRPTPASIPERRCPAKPRARARSGLRSAVPRR